MTRQRRMRAGDWVEVRSREEILATLDENGCLDGLPFMPEMLRHCGERRRIAKSAHKTCDSTHYGDGRWMDDAYFLEDLRCDGSAHAGCQARCLIFFKGAWLKPAGERSASAPPSPSERDAAWLERTTKWTSTEGGELYRCQATQHLSATRAFKWYRLGPFVEDVRSGNWTVRDVVRGVVLQLVWRSRFVGPGWRLKVRLYDRLHRWIYGGPDPHISGSIAEGSATPDVRLDLRAGEWVRVKTLDQIAATLNVRNRNRGLAYNAEISPYSGGTYRVEQRVTRIVDEKSGRLLEMRGPCIMLEGGHCMARYHPEALLCPRRIPQYFREAWLERTQPAPPGVSAEVDRGES